MQCAAVTIQRFPIIEPLKNKIKSIDIIYKKVVKFTK